MVRRASRKFDLKELEEKVQEEWKRNNTYEKTKEALKGGKKYYFLDGPPYASGAIHLGTAYNKILKDALARYLAMRGYNVRRQAGWDCHGLPIEVKVEERLGIKNKKEIEELGIEKFIKECKKWAYEHIEIMGEQFQRLGVWMDWSQPYMTLKDEYIEAAWWTIKRAHEKGLLTKNLRVVTWCPRCETALAEAEIEYMDRADPSIYVKFPVEGKEDEYILIWTTTPWTLIGNLAVMVHPDYEYVRAKTEEGVFILAKELAPILKDKLGLDYDVIETLVGADLEGMRYSNPLSDKILLKPKGEAYKTILADFVSLEEGTGCVHSAPGHGPEDFEACAQYGIEPLCPVDERGNFTSEAGKYANMRVKKDDGVIIEDLGDALLRSEEITHRYGHCWRCKTPIIYRATEQWFISIAPIKEKMLQEIEGVDWVPAWAGSSRFKDWVMNARDWTISRQRYWGIPLPVWVCEKCGDLDVIGSREELRGLGFEVKELHKPYVDEVELKCGCGGIKKRVPDVLDVWFDSGVAAWASLGYPSNKEDFQEWYPADFITEGHDQTRGWFYSQLGCGVIAFNEVPYRRVLMHGFTLDEKGEKMSKSLGNVVKPEEVIDKYGAEVLRFYSLWSNKPWDDLRFNWDEAKVVQKMINVLWNANVFATTYMEIDSYDPSKASDAKKHYQVEDKWIISRLNSLLREVSEAFSGLQINRATRAVQDFILEDLSRWYIPLIRPRTWIEKDGPAKLAAYSVLYEVLLKLSIAMAPITPHLSEEIYRNLSARKESVHLEAWVEGDEKRINPRLEGDMKVARKYVEAEAHAREKRGIKRRWPVMASYFLPQDEESEAALRNLQELITKATTTLDFRVLAPGEKFKGVILKAEPNMRTIGPEFKEKAGKIIEYLRKADASEVKAGIKKGYSLKIDDEVVTLKEEHVNFVETLSERYSSADFEYGTVCIDTMRSDEVLVQGYSREVVRRIQEMRKELDLDIEAFIEARVSVENEKIIELLNSAEAKSYISNETRARKMEISRKIEAKGYEKKWSIDGEEFTISIQELKSPS
jgi:isoleucyl-tRNA synthetase